MALTRRQRELLLAVALAEEARHRATLEEVLGTTWEFDTLVAMASSKSEPDGPLQYKTRLPLLAALAPEALEFLAKRYQKGYAAASRTLEDAPDGGPVIEIGTLSAKDARDLWKKIGSQLATAAATTPAP